MRATCGAIGGKVIAWEREWVLDARIERGVPLTAALRKDVTAKCYG